MEEETWKVIHQAPNYLISNEGRVMNRKTGRILQAMPGSYGHQQVNLRNEGQSKTFFVHKLVATYFCLGFRPGFKVAYHDGDRTNVHATNLYWAPKNRLYSEFL